MIIWSMFDGSGIMGLPWAEVGHTVYCFNADSGNHGEYMVKMRHENLHYINCWIDKDFQIKREILGTPRPDIIFAFPDCTLFSGSGSKHDRQLEEIEYSLNNAKMIRSLGEHYSCMWMIENPVGKLSTLWRKPDHYFDPYEYGGYMTGEEDIFHPRMPPRDAYTKKTCLWVGGGFIMPEKKPVPHIGKFWGWAYLGGKSAKTKQLRSLTPRGFARAVFEANNKAP